MDEFANAIIATGRKTKPKKFDKSSAAGVRRLYTTGIITKEEARAMLKKFNLL